MDTTCSTSFNSDQVNGSDRQARMAADRLGCLLFDTPEFQNYTRLLGAANHDPDVIDLTGKIRDQENNYCIHEGDQPDVDDLYASLEALPVMGELRQAEQVLRRLFAQVDALISATAQAPFAHYARAGCG